MPNMDHSETLLRVGKRYPIKSGTWSTGFVWIDKIGEWGLIRHASLRRAVMPIRMNRHNHPTEYIAKSSRDCPCLDRRAEPCHCALADKAEQATHVLIGSTGEELTARVRVAQNARTHIGSLVVDPFQGLPDDQAEHHVVDGAFAVRCWKQEGILACALSNPEPARQRGKRESGQRHLSLVARAAFGNEDMRPHTVDHEVGSQRPAYFCRGYPGAEQ